MARERKVVAILSMVAAVLAVLLMIMIVQARSTPSARDPLAPSSQPAQAPPVDQDKLVAIGSALSSGDEALARCFHGLALREPC